MSLVRTQRRMAPEQRRMQLLEAAIELYGTRPYEQVSIDDIAAAADVSRALFYRYFSSPTEIYVASLRFAADGLIAKFAAPAEGPLLDQLRSLIGEFISFAESHAAAFIALLRGGSVVATAETGAVVDDVRRHAVAEILARTGVREPSPLALLTLNCWTAVVEGTTLTWLQERNLPREQLENWLVDQLLAMVSATATYDAETAKVIGTVVRP
ncbi:TetR/AcrR family transcriptional regulator [Kibdelosporangium philippinense]|uniref:TetR/AcrR family transcriptional regulator n=1 Tax=Kibdelosporangium philippinense TaxID=211113 RepID=A0ABS8ZUF7_9PSEU|nr:TetR/AcrR family transcriptional regulator [Kibdelosporangium philippinense]MCE7011324.1 TetR/AcrR family transcriptional regulator [Kibdelosporangium philippinense]